MTSPVTQVVARNRLLRVLSAEDFEHIVSDLRLVRLPFGTVTETPRSEIDRVIFMVSGIAFRLVVGRHGELTESGHVGFEGLVGKPVISGASRATNLVKMQVGGEGYAIGPDVLANAMDKRSGIRRLLLAYALTSEFQAECTLLAATNYTISQRLARWLLMYHDRVDGDDFRVTHRLLSEMLNVRRAGITEGMHVLEGRHAIIATRGRVRISDRRILERLAGGSYGIPEAFYDEMIFSFSGADTIGSCSNTPDEKNS